MLTNNAVIFEVQKILKNSHVLRRARAAKRRRIIMWWLAFLGLFSLFMPRTLKADGGIATDKAAHFGIAYALNTSVYSIVTPSICRNNSFCGHTFSAIITSMAGLYWEFEGGSVDWADVRANTIGIAVSTITIRVIEYRF